MPRHLAHCVKTPSLLCEFEPPEWCLATPVTVLGPSIGIGTRRCGTSYWLIAERHGVGKLHSYLDGRAAGSAGSHLLSDRDRRNKLRSSPASCRTPPLPNRVNAMQVASTARMLAPARPVIASPLQLSKTLHPDLIEITHREQHAIDCRCHGQDFAPVIDRIQPLSQGSLL